MTSGWTKPLSRPVGAALALLSGLLGASVFPRFGLWPLAPLVLVPLLLAVRRQPRGTSAWLSALAGLAWGLLGLSWVVATLRAHSGFGLASSLAVYLILVALEAARFSLFGWLQAHLTGKGWRPMTAALLAWPSMEVLVPQVFPWNLGTLVHEAPWLLQTASLGGPIAVTLVVLVPNVALAEMTWSSLWSASPELSSASRRAAILALSCLTAALLWAGFSRLHADDLDSSGIIVGLVQLSPPITASPDDLAASLERAIDLTRQAERDGADLVVWPEASWPYSLSSANPEDDLKAPGLELPVPAVIGALLVDTSPGYWNASLLVAPSYRVLGRTDKEAAVPLAETRPWWLPARFASSKAQVRPAAHTAPLPFEDKRITVLSCYEDVLPALVRHKVRREQPALLVSQTNDLWYPEWVRRAHLGLGRLRAIESRRWMVRVAMGGPTALISPWGTLTQVANADDSAMVGRIFWRDQNTAFLVAGELLGHTWVFVGLLASIFSPWWVNRMRQVLVHGRAPVIKANRELDAPEP